MNLAFMEIVKPENCVLIFPLPRTKKAFDYSVAKNSTGFASNYVMYGWGSYNEFLIIANKLFDIVTGFGGRVYTESSFTTSSGCIYKPGGLSWRGFRQKPGLTGILQDRMVGAVILYSHFDEEQGIEFSDGFKSKEEIINAIPRDYDGVIDLVICNPKEQLGEPMYKYLLKQRPNCNVVFRHEHKVSPSEWTDFYHNVFRNLRIGNMSYDEAAAEAEQLLSRSTI